MSKTYYVRVHTGQMETRYGQDAVSVYADPEDKDVTSADIVQNMWDELSFEPSKSAPPPNFKFPKKGTNRGMYSCEGEFDGTCEAYFKYLGWKDIPIPEGVVKAIQANAADEGVKVEAFKKPVVNADSKAKL